MTESKGTAGAGGGAGTRGGIGLGGAVFIVFLVLKLTGVIAWSWWWVTAPLWGGVALVVAVVLLCFVIAGVAAVVQFVANAVRR